MITDVQKQTSAPTISWQHKNYERGSSKVMPPERNQHTSEAVTGSNTQRSDHGFSPWRSSLSKLRAMPSLEDKCSHKWMSIKVAFFRSHIAVIFLLPGTCSTLLSSKWAVPKHNLFVLFVYFKLHTNMHNLGSNDLLKGSPLHLNALWKAVSFWNRILNYRRIVLWRKVKDALSK